jgi:predicted MFS family arabinose efflux permease
MTDGAPGTRPAGLRIPLAAVLTAAAVVNVGSIYLAQPLLPFIGDSLDAGAGAMAVVQAALQLAFGAGLVTWGILADTRERRRLLTVMASGLLASAVLAAAAPAYGVFLAASLGMGAFAAVLPVLIATAGAAGDRRALVGILSGAPAGIVLGRTLAGLLGEIDWRLAFVLSAVASAAMVAVVRAVLPAQPPSAGGVRLGRALREMAGLLTLPGNLLTNLSNSVVFIGWSAVWTMLSFLLEGDDYGFTPVDIGLVGLVLLGGAVSGQAGMRLGAVLGEAGGARVCIAAAAAAALVLTFGYASLPLLLLGLFVHNAAVWVLQAVNVPGAARRAGQARAARGTALLYLTNFVCTAVGAVAGAALWRAWGWGGVGALAVGSCAVGGLFDLLGRARAGDGAVAAAERGSA